MIRLERLLDYWHSLPVPEGLNVPLKADFDPAAVVDLLPYMTIHERVSRYDMRTRLTGTAIDEILGVNYTDANLFDIFEEQTHDFFATLHDHMFGTPCGSRIVRNVSLPDGSRFQIGSIHLPMAKDANTVNYLLTLMTPEPDFRVSGDGDDMIHVKHLRLFLKYIDLGYGVPLHPAKGLPAAE